MPQHLIEIGGAVGVCHRHKSHDATTRSTRGFATLHITSWRRERLMLLLLPCDGGVRCIIGLGACRKGEGAQGTRGRRPDLHG